MHVLLQLISTSLKSNVPVITLSSIFNTGVFKHRTTLDRNVTTHPGRGARGLLLSIMSQLVEKLMLLLVVVVVLVLIVVKLLIELIGHLTYTHKHSGMAQHIPGAVPAD